MKVFFAFVSIMFIVACAPAQAQTTATSTSAFFPPSLVQEIRANAQRDKWGRDLKRRAIEEAAPWRQMSDEKLWGLMFGATIPRSWHVYSNGNCPACGKPVPMYQWKVDALKEPWKLHCPNCNEAFPKNDFKKFYDSGLDEHGVFDPAKANRSLLYNTEHPDPKDPLHNFGVDDGTGYVRGKERWRFIPFYLVFGQWKQVVHRGIVDLTTAYVLTDDATHARKAAILLDRVADVYPSFDFNAQGLLYESAHGHGYVSVWHDSTIETREMAIAYDALKPIINKDKKLARFLADKSLKYKTPIQKHSGGDIATNIQTRILKDALAHPQKIYSNYPQQYLTTAVLETTLDWPANREKIFTLLDPVIEKSTAVDGVTGEKGLTGYSCYAAQRLAEFLAYYTRVDQTFLAEMIHRHPRLPQMWRFFIDTWCDNQQYYPIIGDTDAIAYRRDHYIGVTFREDHGLKDVGHSAGVIAPSMYAFLWQLYKTTSDPAFAQLIYHQNGNKIDGLPYDLCCSDPEAVRQQLKSVIEKDGAEIQLGNVNKQQWHLSILRSGKSNDSRAVWLDYDAGLACNVYTWGGHSHMDCMNLGLFAKGLDLMPDFGYPPVEYGGWESPRAHWFKSTAAHNTVVINNAEQSDGGGHTTLWADGVGFSAITASAPQVYPKVAKKYDRTVALVDVSPSHFYVLDIFRVAGGHEHDKFFLSHFGEIESSLPMQPATDYSHPMMRDFKVARQPQPGWSVTWKVEDHRNYLPAGTNVRVRYTDFTMAADAYTCQAWVATGLKNQTEEVWMPRVMVRRTSDKNAQTPLVSTFASLIETYDEQPPIKSATRLPLQTSNGKAADDSSVALLINLANGEQDLLVSLDDTAEPMTQPDVGFATDAKLSLVRMSSEHTPSMITLCQGKTLTLPQMKIQCAKAKDFVQIRVDQSRDRATVLAGSADVTMEIAGKPVAVGPATATPPRH